jgi:hypothetical protein
VEVVVVLSLSPLLADWKSVDISFSLMSLLCIMFNKQCFAAPLHGLGVIKEVNCHLLPVMEGC